MSVGEIAALTIRAATHVRGAARITQVSRCASALIRTSNAEHAGYDNPRERYAAAPSARDHLRADASATVTPGGLR